MTSDIEIAREADFRPIQDVAHEKLEISADPNLKNVPKGFTVPVREVRLSGGAEFVVAICGDVMTMPGLPRVPAANAIRFDAEGQIAGLF